MPASAGLAKAGGTTSGPIVLQTDGGPFFDSEVHMMSLILVIGAVLGCALVSLAVIGVAWALSSNRKPPST